MTAACLGAFWLVQTQRGLAVWHDDQALFSEMIDSQPDESYGYIGLASHLLRHRQADAALPVITEGARIDHEGRPVTFGLLAMAQADTGDCAGAAATLDAHFTAGRFPPYALEHAGRCCQRTGDVAGARHQYERCRDQGNRCARHLDELR